MKQIKKQTDQTEKIKSWLISGSCCILIGLLMYGVMLWLTSKNPTMDGQNIDMQTVNIMVTSLFGGVIGLLFGHDLVKHSYSKSWYPTIGMLGTFIGIVLGLYHLDITNITGGLNDLLSGLKLAFLTSICGVSMSGLRKLFDTLKWNKIKETDQAEESLKNIEKQTEGKETLVEILQGMREDLKDFAEKVSGTATKQFTKALSGALSDVAGDLNNKLSEQFGENLAKFGDSVGELIQWQKDNKRAMESYTQQLQTLIDAAKGIEQIVNNANTQIEKAYGTLDELANIVKDAEKFGPGIKKMIEQTNTELTKVMNDISGISTAVLESIQQTQQDLANHNKTIKDLFANTEIMCKEAVIGVKNTADAAKKEVEDGIKQMSENIVKTHDETSAAIKAVTGDMSATVTKNINTMKGSLNTVSGVLSGAIRKMAEDIYTLVNKYAELKQELESVQETVSQEKSSGNKKGRNK